jgi:hypothetical protein
VLGFLTVGQCVFPPSSSSSTSSSSAQSSASSSAFAGVSTRLEYDDSAESTSPDGCVRGAYFHRLEGTVRCDSTGLLDFLCRLEIIDPTLGLAFRIKFLSSLQDPHRRRRAFGIPHPPALPYTAAMKDEDMV